MKILFILLSTVGLVWGVDPQPQPAIKPKELTILLSPRGSVVDEEEMTVNEGAGSKPSELDFAGVNQLHRNVNDNINTEPKLVKKNRTTESRIPIELTQRLFHANNYDSIFNWKTLDLSHLDLSGEDVKQLLYSLDSSTLESIARLDLSHNRVRSLPSRVWPLPLEYGLQELRLDHNQLNLAETSRTSRFELMRLLSLKKLSMSHCNLGYTSLESMEFPPVETLDLSNNQLVDLPSGLATLTSLRHLDVSGNGIRYLGGSPLTALTHLQTLNLSHNVLEKFWDDPLAELFALETLHVDHNALTEPPKLYQFTGSYQPPMDVYLSGNVLKCGCPFRNVFDISRVTVIDRLNVTCEDDAGVEQSVDSAPECSPHLETLKRSWAGTKEWVRDNQPDWSTLYRSMGWIFFGVTLGIVYAQRHSKKTTALTTQVPYNILNDQAVC